MRISVAFIVVSAANHLLGQSASTPANHPPIPKESSAAELDRLTTRVTAKAGTERRKVDPPKSIVRKNYIDEYIFGKMERDHVPHAPLSSDEEFLRRVSLDLIGRLQQPEQVRTFVADKDPAKRDKLVDALTDAKVDPAAIPHPAAPFLDRWTYFFGDLFKNAGAEIGIKGRNLFADYINTALLLDIPYNQFVTEMLTASARSNWQSGPSGFLARNHADDADGLAINHEDTIEDIAISSSKYFLGINLECIACHDGARHLEKINLWLSRRKREEFWRQASFFGGIRIYRAFGIGQEFAVKDDEYRYDLKYPSVKRVQRYRKDVTPAFLLTGEKQAASETPRAAYARMLTADPQFVRATVNMIWAELIGVGIVDPPFEFDLDRQDPKNPPPAPWTIQPIHPELLDALAKDFVANNYSLRHIMRVITKSSAYQLSSRFAGEWRSEYATYFARRFVRRLPAEQLYDAIAQATDVFVDFSVNGTGEKVRYMLQTHDPLDLGGTNLEDVRSLVSAFGQSNRDQGDKSLRGTMVQTSALLNSNFIKDRVRADKGRLAGLMKADPPPSNETVVAELFLATLGRLPSGKEKALAVAQLQQYRESGAEDLLWSLLNRTEFLFY
jgi:hypothetical protein